jgi:hypothetical protein
MQNGQFDYGIQAIEGESVEVLLEKCIHTDAVSGTIQQLCNTVFCTQFLWGICAHAVVSSNIVLPFWAASDFDFCKTGAKTKYMKLKTDRGMSWENAVTTRKEFLEAQRFPLKDNGFYVYKRWDSALHTEHW